MPHGAFQVDPIGAVISIVLTGVGLWLMNIELPPAFAVGLLLPFAGLPPKLYTISVAIGSTTVAVLIWLCRETIRGRQEWLTE
jgi:membrane protein implicated in regulation of membrane protease activity